MYGMIQYKGARWSEIVNLKAVEFHLEHAHKWHSDSSVVAVWKIKEKKYEYDWEYDYKTKTLTRSNPTLIK